MTGRRKEDSRILLNIILPYSPRSPKCGPLPSSFATKTSNEFLTSLGSAARPSHPIYLDFTTLK
jgi:hypothetical protein